MRRFYVSLDDEAFKALVARAVQERRNARDEAALLLEHAIATLPRDGRKVERPQPAAAA